MPLSPAQSIYPVPDPTIIYYHSPYHSQGIGKFLTEEYCWHFGDEQEILIRECLNIPPEYGDPVLAVLLCIVGYQRHIDRDAGSDCLLEDTGKTVSLGGLIGEGACRCRPVEFALRDAVKWNCFNRRESPSSNLITTAHGAEILSWAEGHGIPLTRKGRTQLDSYVRGKLAPVRRVQPCNHRQPSDSNDNAIDQRKRRRYFDGWTPTIHNQLKAKLRTFGYDVPKDLEAAQQMGLFSVALELGMAVEAAPATVPEDGQRVADPEPKPGKGKGGRPLVTEGGKRPKNFDTYAEVFPYWENGEKSHAVIAAAINTAHEDKPELAGVDITEDIVRNGFRWFESPENAEYMRNHLRQKPGKNSKGKTINKRRP